MDNFEVTWKMKDLAVCKVFRIPCIECERTTNHALKASLDCHGSNICTDYWIDHQIVQCLGCETVTYITVSRHGEEWDFDDEGNAYIPVTTHYFPPRSAGRREIEDSFHLPHQVKSIYSETVKALNNDQPILSGIGIRALIESICKEKSAGGRNLQEKIDWLVSADVLTRNDADVLHKIRTLGNEAAHEAKPHDPAQLSLALDICEHLLRGVYLLPHYVAQRLK